MTLKGANAAIGGSKRVKRGGDYGGSLAGLKRRLSSQTETSN